MKTNIFSIFFVLLVFLFSSCKSVQSNISEIKNKTINEITSENKTFVLFSQKPRLFIELFYNQNNPAGLNAKLREKLMHAFSFDNRMQISKDKQNSDFILSGAIDSYFALPLAYDSYSNHTRYQKGIFLTIRLIPNLNQWNKEQIEVYQKNLEELIEGNREVKYQKFYSQEIHQNNVFETEQELLQGVSNRTVHVALDNWFSIWKK